MRPSRLWARFRRRPELQVIPSNQRVNLVLLGGEQVELEPDERVRYVTKSLISTARRPGP